MAASFKKYFRVWKISARATLMQRMAFRFNFLLIVFGVFMQMALSIIFIKVIFGFIKNISGWNFNQALIVVASYMLVEGLNWALFAMLAGIPMSIKLGFLDRLIIKPMSTQFLISVWRADPEDWGRVITAVLVFIYALGGLAMAPLEIVVNGVFYLFLIACASIITYSLTLMIKSLGFFFTETNTLWLLVNQTIRVSQYPTDIFFHKTVRIFFSTIVPLAFMATVPAKIFLHGFDFKLIAFSIVLALIFFIASRKFWKFSLRHYSSASS